MSDLLGKLMKRAKKAEIGHGITEPCVVMSVNNDIKKKNDGETINRNCYTTFGQLNKAGDAIIAEKEVSWFNVDPGSEYAYDNFFTQLDQIAGILYCYYERNDEDGDEVNKKFNKLFEKLGFEDKADLEKAVKDKKVLKKLMENIGKIYLDLMEGNTGIDSQQLRLKLTYDSKGKYLQQPKFDPFTEPTDVESSDSRLKINKIEEEYYQKSLLLATPGAAKAKTNKSNI